MPWTNPASSEPPARGGDHLAAVVEGDIPGTAWTFPTTTTRPAGHGRYCVALPRRSRNGQRRSGAVVGHPAVLPSQPSAPGASRAIQSSTHCRTCLASLTRPGSLERTWSSPSLIGEAKAPRPPWRRPVPDQGVRRPGRCTDDPYSAAWPGVPARGSSALAGQSTAGRGGPGPRTWCMRFSPVSGVAS